MASAVLPDVMIVGAGIVGLSTAYWLAKEGRSVAVVEQGPVPCPLASSADHHRLIRYPYGSRKGYCARMAAGFEAWHAMFADLPADSAAYYKDTGILCLSQREDDYSDRATKIMAELGIPFEKIAVEDLSRRFPCLEPANLAYGTLSEGGALMANRILTDLAAWLRAAGVQILEHSPVARVVPDKGEVHLESGLTLSAGKVVVAAGVGTGRLLPDLGIDLVPHRTMIVYADPPEDLADAYAALPCWNDLGGGTDLWGMPALDGLSMKLGNGSLGRQDPEIAARAMTEAEARAVLDGYAPRFRGIDRFRIRWFQANYWTQAPDSAFQIEQLGRALAVSACSGHGFKFGALSGRDVADAVTEARPLGDVKARMAAELDAVLTAS